MGNMLKLMTMSLMIQIMLSRCEQFVYCLADVRDVSPQSPDIFSPVYSPGVEHHTVMVRKDKSWYFPFMCVVSTCFNPQFAWEKHWDFTCQPFDWFSRVFLGKFAGGCRKTTDVFLKSIWLKPHVCWLNLMKFFVQSLLFSCWTADCSQFPNWSNKRPFLDISDIPISPRCFFRNRTCICSRESGFYPVGGIAWKFRLDMFRTSWGGRPGTTRCYNGWLVHGIHGDNVG